MSAFANSPIEPADLTVMQAVLHDICQERQVSLSAADDIAAVIVSAFQQGYRDPATLRDAVRRMNHQRAA